MQRALSQDQGQRGTQKAIITICRMLLTAIRNVLSRGEPYFADGHLTDRPAGQAKVLATQQALDLIKSWGYIIKDDPSHGSAWPRFNWIKSHARNLWGRCHGKRAERDVFDRALEFLGDKWLERHGIQWYAAKSVHTGEDKAPSEGAAQ